MRFFSTLGLLLTHAICTTFAVQIGRGLSRPIDSVSSISSLLYRHTGYIDQKVRANGYTSLNHESYHLRNVAAMPIPSRNASSGMSPSNITSDSIAIDESFLLPDTVPPNSSTNASSSSSSARLTNLPMLLQSIEALATTSDGDTTWNNQTDAACATALSTLNGVASNPSGMAACYNIRDFDNSSGLFLADLRLFRIAAPTVNWTRLVVSSEMLDVAYAGASLTTRAVKMDGMKSRLPNVRVEDAKDSYRRRNVMERVSRTKRESTTLKLPLIRGEEAKDMYLRRSNGAPPKMLQGFSFTAKLAGNISALTLNETTVHFMLMLLPNITFSGATSDGTSLSTRLSTNDASFVNGLFTQYSTMKVSTEVSETIAADESLPGNNLAVFPVGFIITSVWALLLVMAMGYGTMSKIQARDAYRRRVRSRMSGGMGRLYTSSELETLSKSVQAWM